MTTTEELPNKQFVLQRNWRGFRCISWHPHYIETKWTKNRGDAIINGDGEIDKYWKSSPDFCNDCDVSNPKCDKCLGV